MYLFRLFAKRLRFLNHGSVTTGQRSIPVKSVTAIMFNGFTMTARRSLRPGRTAGAGLPWHCDVGLSDLELDLTSGQ